MPDDHPTLAVDTMLWTARAAEDLKRAAGIRAGGRPLENPVKHFSLNWHRSQNPTREQMIEAAESFLAHMKWSEHEALIVCHGEEGKQPHVHVMLCAVHPETGRALDTSFENTRAQTWAREYERQQELIFCDERLKPFSERTASPTRATWQQLRAYEKEDDRIEQERVSEPLDYFERGTAAPSHEWRSLKERQQEERITFFAEGKEAYRQVRNEAYREVRTEFRNEWATYYDSKRRGMETESLAEMKADIIARQSAELDSRRGVACQELRTCRDWDYAQLLRRQGDERQELRDRQQLGLRSPRLHDLPPPSEPEPARYEAMRRPTFARDLGPEEEFFITGREISKDRTKDKTVIFMWDVHDDGLSGVDRAAQFHSASREVCSPDGEAAQAKEEREEREDFETPAHGPTRMRDPADAVSGIGLGALGALTAIAERLFDGFMGGTGKQPEAPRSAPPKTAMGRDAQEAARRVAAAQARNDAEEQEAAKIKAWWDERRRRSHERD
jgi:hypothetical protein